jgi:hypothetical protein
VRPGRVMGAVKLTVLLRGRDEGRRRRGREGSRQL